MDCKDLTVVKGSITVYRCGWPKTVYLLYIWQCGYVCMFAIGAHTVGATELKFGTELGSLPESVFG